MDQNSDIVNTSTCHTPVPKSGTNVANCNRFVPLPEIAGPRATRGLQPAVEGSDGTVPNTVQKHISTWRKNGLSDRQIREGLKNTFPSAYANTYRHWRTKCSNAHAQGIPTDDAFRDFITFLLHCGFKPGPRYEIHRIDNNLGYSLSNVMWINPNENKHFRGDAHLVDRYKSIAKVSKRTAYRHLKKDRSAFLLKIGQTDAPPKTFDPTQKRYWEEANFLFRRFFEELELVNPNTIIPKKPSRKQLGQLLHIVQAFDYADVIAALPAAIKHWSHIADSAKTKYAIYIGDEPSLDKLLQHPQVLLELANGVVREKQKAAHRAFTQLKEQARRAEIETAAKAEWAKLQKIEAIQKAVAENTKYHFDDVRLRWPEFMQTLSDAEGITDAELLNRAEAYFTPLANAALARLEAWLHEASLENIHRRDSPAPQPSQKVHLSAKTPFRSNTSRHTPFQP